MDLSGSYFKYNGISSRKYGLIFAHIDTENYQSLSGEIQSNVIFEKGKNRNYLVGETFDSSPITFEAEVILDHDRLINTFDRREIEKWLFHQKDYCRLYTDMDCDIYGESYELVDGIQKRLYLNCRFINPQKIEGNGGLVGYRFTVECDSCMAWQDEIIKEFVFDYSLSESWATIVVNVDSDLRDYIYPRVTIVTGNTGGDISIINVTDDPERYTAFIELSPNINVVMRGDGVNYISGSYYNNFSGKNFVRLLDGENKLMVSGDITKLIFEFQNRRYL